MRRTTTTRVLALGALALSWVVAGAAGGTPSRPQPAVPAESPFAGLLSTVGSGAVPNPFVGLSDASAGGAGGPDGADAAGWAPAGAPASTSAPAPAATSADPDATGTITTVAGGLCEGLPALEATIDPGRVAVDKAGRLFWVDQLWGQRHKTSVVLRTLSGGRVRTLGALFDRPDGPYWRGIPGANDLLVDIVPDDHGGLYYTYTRGYEESARRMGSYPLFGYVGHIDAMGRRTVLIGAPPGASLNMAADRVGDGAPPLGAHFDAITAVALDPARNIYFLADQRLWVYNRGQLPLVFYQGTTEQRIVRPGRVSMLTGWKSEADPLLASGPQAASTYRQIYGRDLVVDAAGVVYLLAAHSSLGGHVDAINTTAEARTLYGAPAPPGRVTTVVGGRATTYGYTPDGAPAAGALFALTSAWGYGGIALDRDGDLLLTDTNNHAVRRVDATSGLLSTAVGVPGPGDPPIYEVPGRETGGFNGDGRPALETLLRRPMGVAVDPAGRVVVADWNNQRIRRVETAGVVRTVAGRGFESPCGDGHAAVGDAAYGGAFLGLPSDVAEDSKGNRYVSDGMWRVVRKIDRHGRVSTAVGVPAPCRARSNEGQGNVPLVYSEPQCPLGTYGGDGGPPEKAGLLSPTSLRVDSYDNLFVVDVDRLRYVNFSSRTVEVVGHTVPPRTIVTLYRGTSQTFDVPLVPSGREVYEGVGLVLAVSFGLGDVDIDGKGNVFLSDTVNHQILLIGRCGGVLRIAGIGRRPFPENGDGGAATDAAVTPHSIAYDRSREVLYASSSAEGQGAKTYLVRAINLSTRRVVAAGQTIEPGRITTVAGRGQAIKPGGDWGDGGRAVDAVIFYPWGLTADRGRLYVADWIYRIRVIEESGVIGTLAGRPYFSRNESFNADNQLRITGSWGDGGPVTDAGVDVPGGMTMTADGSLLVATAADGRIRRIANAPAVKARMHPDRLLKGLYGVDPLFDAVGRRRTGAETWFDEPVALSAPGASHADPHAVAAADGSWYVAANRGVGRRGCDLWQVSTAPRKVPKATQVPVRSEETVDGLSCATAVGGGTVTIAQGVVEPTVPGVTSDAPLTVAIGRTTEGSTETVNVLPGPASAGAPVGAERAWVTATRDGFVLAYQDALGVRIARSIDGQVYVPGASLGVEPARLGPVVAAPDGRTLHLGYAVEVAGVPEVWVARSADGGVTWTTTRVVRTSGMTGAQSMPVVAVDRAGTAYVVWGVDGHVWMSTAPAGKPWGAAVQVDRGMATAVLPWIAAGDAGRVQVVWYGHATDDMNSVGEPQWRVYFAHRPSGTQGIAVPTVVHHGSVCLAPWAGCRRTGDTTGNLGSMLTVAAGPDGGTLVAFTEGPERFSAAGDATGRIEVVSVVRQCRGPGLVAGRAPGACPPPPKRPLPPVPPIEKTQYVPALPPVPVVPLPGLLPCSPLPPGDPVPAVPEPAPEPQPHRPPPGAPRPGLVAIPPLLPPVPVGPPANQPAPGNMPANAQQVNQQPNSQAEPQPMLGLGGEPEEQQETALQLAAVALTLAAGVAMHRRTAVARQNGGRR